jgi:hypothetical protein
MGLPLTATPGSLPDYTPVGAMLLFTFDAATATQTMFKDASGVVPVTSNNDGVYIWKASDGSMKDSMSMVSSGSPAAVYRPSSGWRFQPMLAIKRMHFPMFRSQVCT